MPVQNARKILTQSLQRLGYALLLPVSILPLAALLYRLGQPDVLDLAVHFGERRVHPEKWAAMDDEAVISELTAIRGIGRWTAEMFLMFYLMRPNVLPLDDIGLINGISKGYFSGEAVSRSDIREVAAAWAPFRSVATWYIWRSLDPLPVSY